MLQRALQRPFVMAGLVPAIHVFSAPCRRGCPAQGRAWRCGLLHYWLHSARNLSRMAFTAALCQAFC